MQTLTYVLRFHRGPKSDGRSQDAVAESLRITTVIGPDGVTGVFETGTGGAAVLDNKFKLDLPHFSEWGTIRFVGTTEDSSLEFTTVGEGTLLGSPDADGFSHGVVMWQVNSGTGVFAGATGAITSNFLVNLETDELIDNQFHLIYVP